MAQAILEFESFPADVDVGFELGWDFAHHAVTPPVDTLAARSPLGQGWQAGRTCFGARTLEPTRHVRKWLQLRLNAWRRGRAFEGVQVTPHYLRQIDATWCPITRLPLTRHTGQLSDASVDRVRNDAGYAAGNLAVMSARANAAKGRCGFDDALTRMRLAEGMTADPPHVPGMAIPDQLCGLDAAEWARIAVLCSYVTELPHTRAAGLPLLVLPPNRLRLFNPIQALQALVTRQFGRDGWIRRVAEIEALLPGKPVRRDFQRFVHALLPRIIESGRHTEPQTLRWALEDAWRNPLVLRCWTRFAHQLSAEQTEQLVLRAPGLRSGELHTQAFTLAEATEGWALDCHGFAALPTRRGPAPVFVAALTMRQMPLQPALRA